MQNLFASYNLSKRLQDEKYTGFCFAWYCNDMNLLYSNLYYGSPIELQSNTMSIQIACYAPLYDQVFYWLKNVHNIVIHPDYSDCNSLPVYCVKWHDIAFKESFSNNIEKAILMALTIIRLKK